MTNLITRASFQADMLPIVKKWFGEYKELEPLYKKIYQVESSSNAWETDALYYPFSTLREKPEGTSIQYDMMKQQYTPRYTHTTYGLGFKISMEMMDDGTAFRNTQRFTRELTRSCNESLNIVAARVINEAYTSGKTMDGGDGIILCSASHPSVSGNQSNTISSNADLSEAALESLRTQVRKATDDRGKRINLQCVALQCSEDDRAEAFRILNADGRVGTPDNDPNFLKDTGVFPGGVIASPYFTDLDQFGIITNCMDGLKWYMRKEPAIDSDNEFDTKNACFSIIVRVSNGWSNWRGYYASPGV